MPSKECAAMQWRGIDVRPLRSSARKSGQKTTSPPTPSPRDTCLEPPALLPPLREAAARCDEKCLPVLIAPAVTFLQAPPGGCGHPLTLFSASAPHDGQGRRWVGCGALASFPSCPFVSPPLKWRQWKWCERVVSRRGHRLLLWCKQDTTQTQLIFASNARL